MKKEITYATKYVAYLRKSTDDKEKQVLSLESQKDIIERLSKANNLNIIETIEEKMSAKRPGRPGFGKMIKLIKDKKVDGIVTWSPHRLSRNATDMGEIINHFDSNQLREIVTESHTYQNNPMDLFMLSFQGAQAKFENDNKALDVKGGMEKCARLGIYPSCPPLGYLTDKGGIKGARKRDADPINFPIIRRMWDLLLSGTHTPAQIFNKATEEWGLRSRNGFKLSKSMFYHMINNPFYHGEFEWPRNSGNWYKGAHKPMITKEEFEKVQQMIGKTGRARPIKHYPAYGGCVLHCSECGCAITGYKKVKHQQNGNVHTYHYYFCGKHKSNVVCKQKQLSEEVLEQQIEKILGAINIPEGIHQFMMEWVKSENEKQFEDIYAQNEANKQAYGAILRKIDGFIDMRASGLIDDIQYQERTAEAKKEEARLMLLIKDTDQNVTNWIDTADKMFTFTELAVKRFKEGSPELKRGILVSLGWNLSIKDKQLDLSRENWIQPIKLIAKTLQAELSMFEPLSREITLQDKDKVMSVLSRFELCAGKDLNLRSPKATDLQSVVIDRSTTDACRGNKLAGRRRYRRYRLLLS